VTVPPTKEGGMDPDHLAELFDILGENRLEEYVVRSPDSAANDLRHFLEAKSAETYPE
jgi:hypothetical protein